MAGFILGQKTKQSHLFDDSGIRIPVTVIHTSPCYLLDIRPMKTDSSKVMSVKLGYGIAKSINKPTRGHLTKAGIKTPLRFLKEIRLDKLNINASIIEEEGKKGVQIGDAKIFIGTDIKPEVFFKKGDMVDASGTSKGKGFQGVVRRHGFAGGPKTHGQSDRERAPGSMGQTTTPGRVYKGKRMAGRMGGERVTIQGLLVVSVAADSLTIKGLVPGNTGGLIELRAKS